MVTQLKLAKEDKQVQTMWQSVIKRYRVNRFDLAFLKYIFESYEGVALVTAREGRRGELDLRIAPGNESIAAAVIDHMKDDLLIEPVTTPELDKTGLEKMSLED